MNTSMDTLHTRQPASRYRLLPKVLLTTVLSGLLLAACNPVTSPTNNATTAETATIYRDQYGTPHVFAEDNYGVYFGYGYVLATDRLFQMEMLKRTTEGRVAEVLGKDFLALDTHIRSSYDHRAIVSQLASASAEQLDILQGYADGFNQRIAEVIKDKSTLLPAEFSHYDFMPQAWTAYDVATIFIGSIGHRYSDFNSELDSLALLKNLQQRHGDNKAMQIFNASKWLLDSSSPTTVDAADQQLASSILPDTLSYLAALKTTSVATRRVAVNIDGKFTGTTDTAEIASDFQQLIAQHGFSVSAEFSPASNYWAVGKGRMSDANGMLVNGPQFGFSLPSYVYGIGLHGGDFDVVGNTLLGLPSLLFAHNNHISWGSTAGMSDQVDVFIESLHPENDNQYLHNGSYREFDSWQEVIEVKDAAPVTVIARRSVHGMVQQLDSDNRLAYSRARAWEGAELDSLFGWINLSRDKTLEAARTSISKVATNINFYTMDRQGRLGYTHGGRYPLRHPQQDSRLPTPGTGEWDWQGMRAFSDNPTIVNGGQDIVVNWNNRPASEWISSDLWTQTWSRADRSRFIFEKLQARPQFTVDEVWAVNRSVSNLDITAPFILPYLYEAYKQQPQSALVKQALAALQGWDSRWQHNTEGQYGSAPTIMEQWLSQLLAAVFKDDIGEQFFYLYSATNNPNHKLGPSMGTGPGSKALIKNLDDLAAKKPLNYDFFNGVDYRKVLRSSFEAALGQLQSQQGDSLSQWQLAAYPMQWSGYNFRGVPQALEPASPEAAVQLPAYQNRGSENNLFIARDNGFTAFDVIPPGQSGFVKPDGSAAANSGDQMEMFAQYHYKTVPFSRKEVARVAVSEQRLEIKR